MKSFSKSTVQTDDEIWSAVEICHGDLSIQKLSPLAFSILEPLFNRTVENYFNDIGLTAGKNEASKSLWFSLRLGHGYWNIREFKKRFSKVPGYSERSFDHEFGLVSTYEGQGETNPIHLLNLPQKLIHSFFLVKEFWGQERQAKRVLKNYKATESYHQSLSLGSFSKQDLLIHKESLLQDVEIVESQFLRVSLNCLTAKLTLAELLKPLSIYSDCFHGSDLITEVYSPGPVLNQRTSSVGSGVSLRPKNRPSKGFEGALESLRSLHSRSEMRFVPGSLMAIEWTLKKLRSFLKLRAELEQCSLNLQNTLRNLYPEVDPPLERISSQPLNFGEALFEAPSVPLRTTANPQVSAEHFEYPSQGIPTLQGVGCSAGRIRGRARVILDFEEAHRLLEGEILVTPNTDSRWNAVIGKATGIICETEGTLSHTALLSREHQIPAILGIKKVTSILRDGQEIELDGACGEIYLV